MRIHSAVLLGVLGSAVPAFAQPVPPTFQAHNLVQTDADGLVIDANGNLVLLRGAARQALAGEVPVPFRIPNPRGGTGTYFRTLADLRAVLNNPGTVGVIHSGVLAGRSLGTFAAGIPPITIEVFEVSATGISPAGTPLDSELRPDRSVKGRALIVSGVHAREWMAFESVMRRFEDFQDPAGFEQDLMDLRAGLRPGTREVFYAENLRSFFCPLLNPGSILETQVNFDTFYYLTNTTPGSECGIGSLRHGRFRRKNLRDVENVLVVAPLGSRDPRAATHLLGVDINRNLTTVALVDSRVDYVTPESVQYHGLSLQSEPESQAVHAAALRLIDPSRRNTGVAFLDIHGHLDNVEFPLVLDAPVRAQVNPMVKKYADAVARVGLQPQVVPGFPELPPVPRNSVPDLRTAGSTDSMVLNEFGLLATSLELPVDPDIATIPAPFSGKDLLGTTRAAMTFLVSAKDYPRQRGLAARAIDAALDFGSGPPYVKEVLLLQDKNGDGKFDIPLPFDPKTGKFDGGAAEVIYYTSWERGDGGPDSRVKVDHTVQPDHVSRARWLNGSVRARIVIVYSKPMRDPASAVMQNPAKEAIDAKRGPPFKVKLVSAVTGAELVDLREISIWRWETDSLRVEDAKTISTIPGAAIPEIGAKRYQFDTWSAAFTLNGNLTAGGNAKLVIECQDQVGLELDGDPSTVAGWQDGKFVDYEPGDKGGADETHTGLYLDTVAPTLRKVVDRGPGAH